MTSTENVVYWGKGGSKYESLWRMSASTFPDKQARQMLCANLSERQEGERIWHLIFWCFLDHADIVRSFMGREKERVQIVAWRTQTPEKEVLNTWQRWLQRSDDGGVELQTSHHRLRSQLKESAVWSSSWILMPFIWKCLSPCGYNFWKNGPEPLKLEIKLENFISWLMMRCPRILTDHPHIQAHSKQSILSEKAASANQYIRITWNSF